MTFKPHDHPDCELCRTAATTDGIATGLSRALVALKARAKKHADELKWDTIEPYGAIERLRRDECRACAALIRSLLEATVDP